ncbi:M23 family metallopeptidase [Cellulomonas sp. KH9]|uniref:M23 family metallopeptidase n=1 Tax=Cellulomonas sp. KH9 TaxID=1855324 RepID=UPI0008EB4A61|nr:M23 family metallopeptidase [Cellulomonas sp. KH9]SFK21388.1 Peptidase family M23 [Cellulomonas sp. KH9]
MTTTTTVRAPERRRDRVRRGVAGLMPLWLWGIAAWLAAGFVIDPPRVVSVAVSLLLAGMAFVRPPRVAHDPVEVASPVRGRWTALNSPADQVPSHGVRAYGQAYAVDVLLPSPPGTPPVVPWTGGFARPETFPSFGLPVHAVADGTVVRVVDGRRDHRARTSWPALAYLMTVETLRDLGGPGAVVGNHVVVDHGAGVFSLVAHLRRGSARVAPGRRVAAGDVLGEVGNSGNTSEPHLHVQLMDRPQPLRAAGIPFRWRDARILDDVRDTSRATTVRTEVTPGVPAAGQVFEA